MMSDTIKIMQSKFPNIYNVYDEKTILYTLLTVYANRLDTSSNMIDRLHAMIGIDTTHDIDLEHRWGSMLGLYKASGESFYEYRSRLKIAYPSLVGGTAHAIKYTIASTIGVSDQETIDKCIFVYDAWLYDREIPDNIEIDKSYGNIVCVVDLAYSTINIDIRDRIIESINKTKASGINVFLIFIYINSDNCLINGSEIYNTSHITFIPQQDDTCIISMGDQEEDTALFGHGIFGMAMLGECTHANDEYEDIISYV